MRKVIYSTSPPVGVTVIAGPYATQEQAVAACFGLSGSGGGGSGGGGSGGGGSDCSAGPFAPSLSATFTGTGCFASLTSFSLPQFGAGFSYRTSGFKSACGWSGYVTVTLGAGGVPVLTLLGGLHVNAQPGYTCYHFAGTFSYDDGAGNTFTATVTG